MNDFIRKELKKAFPEDFPHKLKKDEINRWSRRTRMKQLGFLFLETVVLLGIGTGNIINNKILSFSSALGFLCIIVWIFLAINIHKYVNNINLSDEDINNILDETKKADGKPAAHEISSESESDSSFE